MKLELTFLLHPHHNSVVTPYLIISTALIETLLKAYAGKPGLMNFLVLG